MSKYKKAFTLIEMLIVVAIIGILFSVVAPMSVNMYKSYMASSKAQKVLIFLSKVRRHSFLYGQEFEVKCKKKKFILNNKIIDFKDISCKSQKPIIFYNNGTSSGGSIDLYVNGFHYTINVSSILGGLKLKNT